jgi:Transposase
MHAVDAEALQDISARLATRMITMFDLDVSSVALDMTNFATYIDTTNDKAPIAQRGKAKQKRTDLRLVGLGMVVTRAGGIPLVWHAYPGNRPDVTQFPTLIEHLKQRYTHLADHAADTDRAAVTDWPSMTVVFDAGQNSTANFEHLKNSGLHYVGSVPPSDCPDLLALPAADRKTVDKYRFPGLTAIDTHRVVYGQHRRVVLTHSQNLHDDQARSFTDTTLAKVGRQLDDLAATLARGKTRRTHEQLTTDIETITHSPWVHAVIDWELTIGETARDRQLSWTVNDTKREALENNVFGKRILITDHDDWSVADVVAGLPLPIRNRIRIPATQRSPRSVVLPDVPLDRPQHRRPHVHLRPRPATRPPAAAQSPPRQPQPERQSPPGHPQRDRRNRADLPLHRRTTQSPPHDHRHEHRPTSPLQPVQPPPMGPTTPHLGHTDNCPAYQP